MSEKEKPYLKLVRATPPAQTEEVNFDELRGSTLKERLQWRGIEAKSVILGLTSLSIISAVTVIMILAGMLSMVK